MYINLKIEMLKSGIKTKDIAQHLGLHRNTVEYKINGKGCFNMNEATKIRDKFFENLTIDYLFKKQDLKKQA